MKLSVLLSTNYVYPKQLLFSRVAAAVSPPFTTVVEEACKLPSCFKGIYADVFNRLQKYMNFSYYLRKENKWGNKMENGSWSGMIGTFYLWQFFIHYFTKRCLLLQILNDVQFYYRSFIKE